MEGRYWRAAAELEVRLWAHLQDREALLSKARSPSSLREGSSIPLGSTPFSLRKLPIPMNFNETAGAVLPAVLCKAMFAGFGPTRPAMNQCCWVRCQCAVPVQQHAQAAVSWRRT